MLWEHARVVKCSKISQFFDDDIFTYLGPLWVSKPPLGGQKTRKNAFFQYLEAKIVKIIYPWSVLKKTKRGSTFLIPIWGPIWGPRLSGSPESAIFDVIFWKSMDFHIKIASRGAPNTTVPKYNISAFTGQKIMCVAVLVNFLAIGVWR